MALAVTLLGSTFNTTAGTHTVVATPAVGDLIIIICGESGVTTTMTPSDNNSDGQGKYDRIRFESKAALGLEFWVRKGKINSASSTTFTALGPSSTGGGLFVMKITGANRFGMAAIVQSAGQSSQAAGSTPQPTFPAAVQTGNAVIGAVCNITNPANLTPTGTPVYTERADVGYATPNTGMEIQSIDSGETGTTITWGGASATAYCDIVVEIDAGAAIATSAGQRRSTVARGPVAPPRQPAVALKHPFQVAAAAASPSIPKPVIVRCGPVRLIAGIVVRPHLPRRPIVALRPLLVVGRGSRATPAIALLLKHPFLAAPAAQPSVPKPFMVAGHVRASPSRAAYPALLLRMPMSGVAPPPVITDVRFNPLAASLGRLMGR